MLGEHDEWFGGPRAKTDCIHLEGIGMRNLVFVNVSPVVQNDHRSGALADMLGV